jgi:hypothetical protein
MRNEMFDWNRIATLRLVPVVVLAVVGLAPLCANTLTNDMVVLTESSACANCAPVFIRTFGTTSSGGPSASGGLNSAQTAWFPDHFGEFARGALNSTSKAQSAGGFTYSATVESILIPPQQGMLQGDPGTFQLFYHLDGTVTIDVGQTFDPLGNLLSGGQVDLAWDWSTAPTPFFNTGVHRDSLIQGWGGSKVSDVVNRDVIQTFPFQYGVLFYYETAVSVTANASSGAGPSEGFAEGDFLHTGTLNGATVLDKNGNPITNPVVISDSGFDYVHPRVSTVPEPSSAVPLGAGLGGLILALRFRKSRPSAAPATTT